jgi:hypothetical protein
MPERLRPVLDKLLVAFEQACAGTLTSKQAHLIAPISRAIIACVQAGEQELLLRAIEQRAVDEGRFRDQHGRARARGGPIQWPALDG